MEHFYREVIGYEVVWRPDEDNVYLSSGSDNLAQHAAGPAKGETRLDHLGLMVPEREDVDRWHEHLTGLGINMKRGPGDHRDGSRSLYFEDPEGNVVQVLHVPPAGLQGSG